MTFSPGIQEVNSQLYVLTTPADCWMIKTLLDPVLHLGEDECVKQSLICL